jgi:hypothetical protein
MAEIIGYLKERASQGQRQVLEALSQALPEGFQIYVESPLRHRGMDRMPDFIVVTDLGVVILEVKNWTNVVRGDEHYAVLSAGEGRIYRVPNAVEQARELAHVLASRLRDSRDGSLVCDPCQRYLWLW